jgi:hypothetical protein
MEFDPHLQKKHEGLVTFVAILEKRNTSLPCTDTGLADIKTWVHS